VAAQPGRGRRRQARRIFPLVATLFIFIITANYAGLLPFVGTVGRWQDEGGHRVLVPFFRAPNADLNMTIAMALLAFVIVQYSGIAAHGVGGYLKELTTPILLAPIHLVSELSRIISLSARLFGNIFGGEVALGVITALTIAILPAAMLLLEGLLNFVQALIFSTLMLMYTIIAVEAHDDAGHTEEGIPEGNISPPIPHPQPAR
jgi:F-type H+-transporting ATPase subunit a